MLESTKLFTKSWRMFRLKEARDFFLQGSMGFAHFVG